MFALLSSISFAVANAIQSKLSATHGVQAISMYCFGGFSAWSLYHTANWIFNFEPNGGWNNYIKRNSPERSEKEDLLNSYDDNFFVQTDEVDYMKLSVPVLRAFFSLMSNSLVFLTFEYVNMCSENLNSGIFASLFCSSIVYTTLMFYLFYHQKPNNWVLSGITCIIASIVLITWGSKAVADVEITDEINLHIAIMLALLVGFEFAIGMVLIKLFVGKFSFPPMQLNMDTSFAVSILFLPVFIYGLYTNPDQFTAYDIMMFTLTYYIKETGLVMLTLAIKYGHGGPVDAIKNLSVLWQTIIMAIVSNGKQMPTLHQTSGMLLGLLGGNIILFKHH